MQVLHFSFFLKVKIFAYIILARDSQQILRIILFPVLPIHGVTFLIFLQLLTNPFLWVVTIICQQCPKLTSNIELSFDLQNTET